MEPEMIDIPSIQGDNKMSEEDAVEVVTVTVYKCTCQRCGYVWTAKKKPPGYCANLACRSPNWRTSPKAKKGKVDKSKSCG